MVATLDEIKEYPQFHMHNNKLHCQEFGILSEKSVAWKLRKSLQPSPIAWRAQEQTNILSIEDRQEKGIALKNHTISLRAKRDEAIALKEPYHLSKSKASFSN